VKVYTREEWGAQKRNGFGTRKYPVSTAHIHHDAGAGLPETATVAQEKAYMRRIEASNPNGTFPYNRAIFASGRVYAGTSFNRVGAHTKGHNTKGAGFVLIGNFQTKNPTKKQWASLIKIIRQEKAKGRLKANAPIYGHFETSATACPGAKVRPRMAEIRKDAAKPLALTPKDKTVSATVNLKNKKSRLNLRAKASASSKVLAAMPHGTRVTVVSRGTAWTKVKYGTKTGYASTPYLKF
jgi:hypothetical protein